MKKVIVEASVVYAILIGRGLLAEAGTEIAKRIAPCKAAIVTDSTVEKLYGAKAEDALQKAGFCTCRFSCPAGEGIKNLSTIGDILEFLAEEEMTRQDIIVALGGGVIGDMAGFAAAIYQRGIRFVQIPTTLLAAVDSSVGGKTGVDLRAGKNLAGAFHQPHLVLCDPDLLDTLPEESFRDGMAEVLKYGVIGNPRLFAQAAAGNARENLAETIEMCVKMKRELVMEDEFDTGRRQLLNLGHTLGHAMEKRSGYTLSHGRAVAIGLHLMAKAAEKRGLAEAGLAETIRNALEKNGLPSSTEYAAEELAAGILQDKKRRGSEISFIFPVKIGQCEIVKIPVDAVLELVKTVV